MTTQMIWCLLFGWILRIAALCACLCVCVIVCASVACFLVPAAQRIGASLQSVSYTSCLISHCVEVSCHAEAARCGSFLAGSAVWYKMWCSAWWSGTLTFLGGFVTFRKTADWRLSGRTVPFKKYLIDGQLLWLLTALMSNSLLFSIGALSLSVARQHSLIRALQNQQCWLNSITLFLSVAHTSLPPATIFNHLLWNYQNYLPFSNMTFNVSRCRNIVGCFWARTTRQI